MMFGSGVDGDPCARGDQYVEFKWLVSHGMGIYRLHVNVQGIRP